MPATMMASSTLSMATLATSAAQVNKNNNSNKGKTGTVSAVANGQSANSSCHRFSGSEKHQSSAVTAPSSHATATTGRHLPDNGNNSSNKSDQAKPPTNGGTGSKQPAPADSRGRRHIIEEVNDDSIYCIYLKKITYTFNNSLNKQANSSNYVTRCDQVDCSGRGEQPKSNSKWYDDQQVSTVQSLSVCVCVTRILCFYQKRGLVDIAKERERHCQFCNTF